MSEHSFACFACFQEVCLSNFPFQVILSEHRSPSYLWSLCFQTYPLYSWPDNIQVDEGTGDLYVASHPILHRFLVYTDDVGSLHSPSQVIKKPIRKAACLTLRTPYSRENMVKLGVEAYLSLSTTGFFFFFSLWLVPAGSPSRGGDVKVFVLDINQPSLPTPFTLFLCLFLSHGPFTCISFHKFSRQLPGSC